MPAEVIQQEPGGLSLVRFPDGREEWYPPDLAQEQVQLSYDTPPAAQGMQYAGMPQEQAAAPSPVPNIELPSGPGALPPPTPEEMAFAPEESVLPPQAPAAPPPAPVAPTPGSTSQSYNVSMPVSAMRPMRGVPSAPQAPDLSPILAGAVDTAKLGRQSADRQLEADRAQIELDAQHARNVAELEESERVIHQTATERAAADNQQYQYDIDEAIRKVPSVDPGRVWTNAGSFGSAMGILSAGVGGWLQVMHGGPNHALEQINKLVEMDIHAQGVDIDTAKEKVFRAERKFERGQANTAERFQRLEEQRLFRLRTLTAAVEADAAKMKSPIAQAKYAQTLGMLNKELFNTYGQLVQSDFSNRTTQYSTEMGARHQVEMERQGRIGLSISARNADTAARAEARAAKGAEGVKEEYILDPITRERISIDSSVANKDELIKNLSNKDLGYAGYGQLSKDIREYVGLLTKHGKTYGGPGSGVVMIAPDAKARQELDSKYQQIASNIRHSMYGAALTENEAKNFTQWLPKPPGWTGLVNKGTVENYLNDKISEAQTKFINPLGATKAGVPVDLRAEWGLAPSEETAPQDAVGLSGRMEKTVQGIMALDNKAAPDSARALVKDATSFLDYAKNYAGRTGMTRDLAASTVQEMRRNAGVLDSRGYGDEADKLFTTAAQLEDLIEEADTRAQNPEPEYPQHYPQYK